MGKPEDRRRWTEEEWDTHFRAIEPLRRSIHEHLGPMQDDAIRRHGWEWESGTTSKSAERLQELLERLAASLVPLPAPQPAMDGTGHSASVVTGHVVRNADGDCELTLSCRRVLLYFVAVATVDGDLLIPRPFVRDGGILETQRWTSKQLRTPISLGFPPPGKVLVLYSNGEFLPRSDGLTDPIAALESVLARGGPLQLLEIEIPPE